MRSSSFMKRSLNLLALVTLSCGGVTAEAEAAKRSERTLASLGIAIQIPEGWEGQEASEGFVLQSSSESGVLLVGRIADATIEGIKAELAKPIELDAENALAPAGAP